MASWTVVKGTGAATVTTQITGTIGGYTAHKLNTTGEAGYTFRGWYDSSGGLAGTSAEVTLTEKAYPGNQTFTAVWGIKTIYSHTVKTGNKDYGLIKRGSSSATSKTNTMTYWDGAFYSGSDLDVTAEATNTGVFTGFSGDTGSATIEGKRCIIPKEVEGSVTITANFVKKVTLTLSYNANGGTNAPASQSQSVGQGSSATFTLAAAPTPPQGYSFTGWKVGNTTYAVGASVSISASTSAVAQYAEIPAHTVSFDTSPANIGTPATIATSPTRTESGVDYYADASDITIQPQAINGYTLKSVTYYDASNPDVAIGSKTITDGSLAPFALSSANRNGRNMLLRFNYDQIDYTLTAGVHTASSGKVTASVEVGGESAATAHWGDTATFTATGVSSGYSFAGWYDADGVLQSSEVAYEVTVQGDIALYAKCKVECSVTITYPSGTADADKTCSLTKDGEAYTPGTDFDVVLGDSFAYALTLGVSAESGDWVLDSWKVGSSVQILPLQGTVTPSSALALVADVKSVEDASRTLTVNTAQFELDGNGKLVRENIGVDGVNPYTFEGNIAPTPGTVVTPLDVSPSPPPAGQYHKDFSGVQYVRLTAATSATLYGDTDASVFRGFYGTDGALITNETSIVVLMAADREVWAAYGVAGLVEVDAEYADSDSANRGSIAIIAKTDTDAESSIAQDGRSANVTQGTWVTFRAVPKNGYEFAGWYATTFTGGDPLYAGETYEYQVMAAASVYAKFLPARDQICAWEGSTESKTMEWTSKVYTMPRPFDPVAARVDAAGYPLDLTVRTYSSPDKVDPLPVRDHELTRENPLAVQSQDGRRLPRMRPERFVQFTVQSTHEVDAVAIGTNMAEVN